MAKLNKADFIAALKEMTILEIKELVDGLKEEFGIDPTAVAVAGPAAGAAPVQEEQTEFTVTLTAAGATKIAVIKVVREITGLGLSESKALVETANATIKENVAKEAANEMVEKFKAAGATVELK